MDDLKEKANYCLGCKIKKCQIGCPLGNDITEFIRNIKEENFEQAYKVLCQTTVLQPICGRICPHKKQCEGSCVRGIKGESVSIGDLEAYIGDLAIEKGYKIEKFTDEEYNQHIAIIGGGPAGISAAAYLKRSGYNVTIYEKYNELGGILMHGIPEFRLSKDILKRQINKILELGINVQYNKELGKDIFLSELEKQYDAIFLSFGANISSKMGIEGEELLGVYGGNELLEKGDFPEFKAKTVAVIGGGNVAMDTSRTIKKLGAKNVYVIYRRAREQMPAEQKEIEDAIEEGVEFLFQNNIIKIIGEKSVQKIECIKTELVKVEGDSRLVPVNIEGSNYQMDMDYVIMAVGSKTEEEIVSKLGLELSKNGYIKVDENGRTSNPKIFAGGDLANVKSTVAWASCSGRETAKQIIKYLEENR